MIGMVVRRVRPVGIARVNLDASWKKKAIPVPSGFETVQSTYNLLPGRTRLDRNCRYHSETAALTTV
jgi:hypothetical protein